MMRLLVCFLMSGLSFPAMLFERLLPNLPSEEKIDKDGTWFHRSKDRTTETIRADVQWWSKFLCFIILGTLICLIALIILMLKIRLDHPLP